MVKMTEQRMTGRRDAIIAAAQELFARNGFAETSMADIVRASGVATGTVYRYFDSKEAIVMAATERVMGISLVAQDAPALTLRDAIGAMVAAASDEHRGGLSNQVWAKAVGAPALQAMIAERHARVCATLARLIEGTVSGEPGAEALQRAEVVLCAVSGLQQRMAVGLKVDVEGFTAALISLAEESE
ncbi:helix-turn-helix domain-containing protein [Amycolatopsis sp. NPDC051106]|uniref:TetR/AcrR family transcriptional regulator n=1 Tax=unclassified Amycolatopsis TaxID=2618356 RepID=UPI00343FF309